MSTIAASRIKYLQSRICRFDDQLAYKEVYLNFYPSLLLFISGIIKSKQYAEELVSDLFIKIWEKRKTLEEIQNFRVYCFVAARNLSINQLEKMRLQRTTSLDGYQQSLANPNPDPEQLMISAEMVRRIYEVVEQLPPRCKLAFKLVKEHGFKYKEAAEILEVAEKTIENQLAIALKKISSVVRFDISRSIPLTANFH